MSNPPPNIDRATEIDDAMARIRAVVGRQLGVERPLGAAVDPSTIPRFGKNLPSELSPEQRAELVAEAERLDPWLQGPFWLGGDLVIGGAWRNDARWHGFGEAVPANLSGKRVLDVGSNAGYDPFMFHLRGAEYVLGAEPFMFLEQARFLERLYQTGIDFQPLGWQDLDPAVHGTFDLVHCHGVLYHDMHPMALLQRLREMLAPDGTLYFGSMMLGDPELSEYARFVPGSYYGDATWWWVPGRLAMRWMLESVGLEVRRQLGSHAGPPGEFATINGYFECCLSDASPVVTRVDSSTGASADAGSR
jgi:tRNA (mo5U34)-methyltransferase